MIALIRYLLLGCLPFLVWYSFWIPKEFENLKKANEEILIFERYEDSGGSFGDGSSPDIYASGKVNNLESSVKVGSYKGYEEVFIDLKFSNLKIGSKLPIWYYEKSKHAWLRQNNETKEGLLQKFIFKNVLYISIYLISLMIFETLYRKNEK